MGINNLLPNLKSITKKKNISSYQNQSCAIDGYSWLHKALHTKALISKEEKTVKKYITYFSIKIEKLLSYNIKITIIWDGDRPPLKKKTSDTKYILKKYNYKNCMKSYKKGQIEKAMGFFNKGLLITPGLVFKIQKGLKTIFKNKINFLVAPYEADSQLAFLNKNNHVDFIISEDSDLLVFGAKKIFFKMDKFFNGEEIELENLKNCKELNFKNWKHTDFVQFCIFLGCDYLKQPNGIGIKRAYSLIQEKKYFKDRILFLKNRYEIDEEYEYKFLASYLTFRFMWVYCPKKNDLVKLNDFNKLDKFDEYAKEQCIKFYSNLNFLGRRLNKEIAVKIKNCEIDPFTKESFISRYDILHKIKKTKTFKNPDCLISASFIDVSKISFSDQEIALNFKNTNKLPQSKVLKIIKKEKLKNKMNIQSEKEFENGRETHKRLIGKNNNLGNNNFEENKREEEIKQKEENIKFIRDFDLEKKLTKKENFKNSEYLTKKEILEKKERRLLEEEYKKYKDDSNNNNLNFTINNKSLIGQEIKSIRNFKNNESFLELSSFMDFFNDMKINKNNYNQNLNKNNNQNFIQNNNQILNENYNQNLNENYDQNFINNNITIKISNNNNINNKNLYLKKKKKNIINKNINLKLKKIFNNLILKNFNLIFDDKVDIRKEIDDEKDREFDFLDFIEDIQKMS